HHENAVQIEWLTSQLEIEIHAHGVSQDLANEPILQVPQITHADPCHGKVLSQLGANCFNDFAPVRTRAYQVAWLSQRHTSPWWSDDRNPLVRGEYGMLVLVNEAFVRRDDATGIAFEQGCEAVDVVRAGRQ